MVQSNKLPEQPTFVNLTDYSTKCPEGMRSFFAFVNFEDESYILLSHIYAKDRKDANIQVLRRFADCLGYIYSIAIQESSH